MALLFYKTLDDENMAYSRKPVIPYPVFCSSEAIATKFLHSYEIFVFAAIETGRDRRARIRTTRNC